MADFKTHIATSTVIGVGYGAAAYFGFEAPLTSCLISAGLCSVAGMLPDLDSDSGVPLRETMAFSAAIIPMLLLERFEALGLGREEIVLAAALTYIAVRFGVAEIFRRYTVHRGMWHSIPAAATVGLVAFLICGCYDINIRLMKAGAVVLGFLVHLVLDEIYAVDWSGRRIKRSFGTALKLWDGKHLWPNVSTYGKLALLILLTLGDPVVMDYIDHKEGPNKHAHTARQWFDGFIKLGSNPTSETQTR